MAKGIFITANYHNSNITIGLLKNLSEMQGIGDLEIAVVDNTETLGDYKKLKEFSVDIPFTTIHLYKAPKNLGYFGGADFALQRIKDTILSYDYIIIANNDIVIKDQEFFIKLVPLIGDAAVIAPDIISTVTGKHQNPHRLNPVSKGQKFQYSLLYTNYYLAWFLYNVRRIAKSLRKKRNAEQFLKPQEIFSAHGAFIIFSSKYFREGGTIDSGYFLFGEEDSVAAQCRDLLLKIVYRPELVIYHNEHLTTGGSGFKKNIFLLQKKSLSIYQKPLSLFLPMKGTTFISIIIPCRNEEKFIATCLNNVINFQLQDGCSTEILVIDGMSEDRTRDIVSEYQVSYPELRLIENPEKIQSCALNIGIKESKGQYLLRLDAHSEYPPDYLYLLLATARRSNADNTGGLVITKPFNNSYNASIVQALTTHIFGVGNSGFRVGMKEGVADTVPYGFFRKDIFEKTGYFDERLIRAQDYEFNRRIIKSGGIVWFNPAIKLNYYNQPDFIKFIKKQITREAPYNAYMWYLAPYSFAYRHAITGVFTAGILTGSVLSVFFPLIRWIFFGVLFLYILLAFASSVQQSIRFKKAGHVFVLPVCFFLYHFMHGAGVLWGLLNIILRTAPVLKKKEPWKGANRFRAYNRDVRVIV